MKYSYMLQCKCMGNNYSEWKKEVRPKMSTYSIILFIQKANSVFSLEGHVETLGGGDKNILYLVRRSCHLRIWLNLENFRLSEVNQTEKIKTCMISLKCGINTVEYIETYSRTMVTRSGEVGEMGRYCSKRTKLQFCSMYV